MAIGNGYQNFKRISLSIERRKRTKIDHQMATLKLSNHTVGGHCHPPEA